MRASANHAEGKSCAQRKSWQSQIMRASANHGEAKSCAQAQIIAQPNHYLLNELKLAVHDQQL
ncbi:MAG: hypothetical protein IK064_02340, partial [Clostridia bacterium]|nr:hypothetical protein [Clostridia bacterium]